MNRALWLIAAGLTLPVHAQHRLPADPALPRPADRLQLLVSAHQRAVVAEGALDYNANALLNELPLALWQGAFLDRGLRIRSRDELRTRNRIGYLIDARITSIGPVQGAWRPILSMAHHEHFGLRFPADLFNLTFFGNAGYEARRADIGPAAFMRMRYQTIGFGARHAHQSHYARIDLVIGQSLEAADIAWADLFTATDGRALRANVRGDYLRSDTASSKAGTLNGLGLAFSGRWQLPLRPNARGPLIELEAEDLGFCSWGRGTQRLRRDTTLLFEGITVDNILELDEVILGEEQVLDTLGIRFSKATATTWLPFRLSARMRGRLGEDWKGAITIDQRYLPGYVPQFSVQGERSLGKRTDLGAAVSMGGFGGLRLGVVITHVVKDMVLLSLATPHLPAFVNGKTRGAGLTFAAAVAF